MSGISNECWVARCSTIVFPPSLFFQFFNNFPPVHTVLNLFSLLLFLFSIPFLSIFFISLSYVEVCSSFFCLASPCRYPPVLSIERFGVKIFTRARVRFFRFFSQFRGIVRTGVYLPLRAVFFFSFLLFFYARPVVCSFCEDSRIYETVTLPRNDRVSIECEGYEHNCGGTMKFMTRPYRFFVLFLSLLLNIERNDAIILW